MTTQEQEAQASSIEQLIPGLRKRSQFTGMSPTAAREATAMRWNVARRVTESLLDAIEAEEIPVEDVPTLVHHTIAVSVASIFGYAPKDLFTDVDLLGYQSNGVSKKP